MLDVTGSGQMDLVLMGSPQAFRVLHRGSDGKFCAYSAQRRRIDMAAVNLLHLRAHGGNMRSGKCSRAMRRHASSVQCDIGNAPADQADQNSQNGKQGRDARREEEMKNFPRHQNRRELFTF